MADLTVKRTRQDPLNPGKTMPVGKYRDGQGQMRTVDDDPEISRPKRETVASRVDASVEGAKGAIKAKQDELQKYASGGMVHHKAKKMGKCC